MELISVIIPVYNVEEYLVRCVESIKTQTYSNLEIILVDDGSPDGCPKICDQMALDDSRIKVIHKQNGGQGLARNSGIEIATGKYVAFVDSDDWMNKNYIENLYSAISQNEADIVIASHSIANNLENIVPKHLHIKEGVYNGEDVKNEILLPIIGPNVDFFKDVQIESAAWGKLYRLDIVKQNNIRFPSERVAVGEDMFFNALYLYHSKCAVVINDCGYRYFENLKSTTRKYNPLRYERTLNFYTNARELVEKLGLQAEIGHRVERTFLLKLRTAIRLVVISDMPRREKIYEIGHYLNNPTVVAVLKNYPINSYVFAIRLLSKLMRSKNAAGVYYLTKLREAAKGQTLLKELLKFVGIGK